MGALMDNLAILRFRKRDSASLRLPRRFAPRNDI